jgi:hypothetical protein
MTDPNHLPSARKSGLSIQRLDDEVLVYDLERDVAHCLSPDAARVWEACDGVTPVAALATELSDELVADALGELAEKQLLEEMPQAGLSRRRFMGRVVATAAATPLIVSVAAQPAAAQDSCVQLGGRCQGTSDCCGSLNCRGSGTLRVCTA